MPRRWRIGATPQDCRLTAHERNDLLQILFFILLSAAVASGWLWGGLPERIGAVFHLALASIQGTLYILLPPSFLSVDTLALGIDCLGLLAFGWLALRANRFWPIWAAAFQLVSLAGHFARWVQMEIEPLAYVILKSYPTAFGLVVLLIGVLLHQTRLRRYGIDHPWAHWVSARSN